MNRAPSILAGLACAALLCTLATGCLESLRSTEQAEIKAAKAIYAQEDVQTLRSEPVNRRLQDQLPDELPVEVLWTVPLRDREINVQTLWLPPARVEADLLVALTTQNDLLTFRRGNGVARWWTRLGATPMGTPTFSDYSVYTVVNGYLLCLEITEGEVFWRLRTKFPPSPNMTVNEPERGQPRITMAALNRMVHGLSVMEVLWPPQGGLGKLTREDILLREKHLRGQWHHPTEGIVEGAVARAGGYVFVADSANQVYCLNPQNLRGSRPRIVWRTTTRGPNTAGVVVEDTYALVASRDRNLYCYSRINGGDIWRFSAGEILVEPPVWIRDPATEQAVVLQRGREGTLFCLSATTGDQLWTLPGTARVCGLDRDEDRPPAEQTAVVVQLADGALRALRLRSGETAWSLPGGILGPAAAQAHAYAVYATNPNGDQIVALGRVED
ncbi:MAG: PQQ-binding-like beta-propeller repeat protein [Planctomycetota bacterium]